jgi:hypothetical protein
MSMPVYEEVMNPEAVATLERERLQGMPRWRVKASRRFLVTGSRRWDDRETIFAALTEVYGQFCVGDDGRVVRVILVHGASPSVKIEGVIYPGADQLAQDWAEALGIRFERYPADWTTLGRRAGPRRNQTMVEQEIFVCVAFPRPPLPGHGWGTEDCVKRALRKKIPVINYGTVAVAGVQPQRVGEWTRGTKIDSG